MSTTKFTLFPQLAGERNLMVSKSDPLTLLCRPAGWADGVEQAFMPAVQANDRSGFQPLR
jgi:hypothetical protein